MFTYRVILSAPSRRGVGFKVKAVSGYEAGRTARAFLRQTRHGVDYTVVSAEQVG